MIHSWKTSLFGCIGLICGAAAGYLPQYAVWFAIAGTACNSIAAMFARDNDVTSEQVGAGNVPPIIIKTEPPLENKQNELISTVDPDHL